MKRKIDLAIDFCGVKLRNPLILASGVMGISKASLLYIAKSGAGAVTTKSVGPCERTGHPNPTVFSWEGGLINAVGLSNPGINQSLSVFKEILKNPPVPVIISFFADTISNFCLVCKKLLTLKPRFIELNASCPNTLCEYGTPFAVEPASFRVLIREVKKIIKTQSKLIVKLSPQVPSIGRMGKIAEEEGADAICAINTVPGMLIDIYARKPILSNFTGGISGRSIKPIALKAIYDLYKQITIPIIGLGGIENGEDVLAMIMAGATAVGVGSAVYTKGIDVFSQVTAEMREIMKRENISNLNQIRGIVHAK